MNNDFIKYEEKDYVSEKELKIFKKLNNQNNSIIFIPGTLRWDHRISKTGKKYAEEKIQVRCPYCGEVYEVFLKNLLKGQEHICRRQYKTKKVFLKKYGVDNPMKNKKIAEKCFQSREKTFLEKYGSLSTQDFMEKRKKTVLERYGVENVMQDSSILERRTVSNLEKQGYSCTLDAPEVAKKARRKYLYDGVSFDSSYKIAVYHSFKKKGIILIREPKTNLFYKNEKGKLSNYKPDFLNPETGQYIEAKGSWFIPTQSYRDLIYREAIVLRDEDHTIDPYLKEARADFGGEGWYRKFRI